MARTLQVVYGSHNTNTSIVGTTSNYLEVRKYAIDVGRMFASSEDAARRRVAVLGPQVVSDLGQPSAASIVGETVRVDGAAFLVIGVLAPKGQTGGFQNPDDQVLIPLQTAQARLMGGDRLRSLNVLAPSEDQIPATMAEVTRILRREHHLRAGDPDDFTIRNQADFLATLGETTQVFTWLLAGIAAVSLLVGGIGIMNIMLVSVTERTREIGLRMAIGARGFDVLLQFLVEAIVLSLVGGAIGIAGGLGAADFVQWYQGIVIAFLFAGAVGVFFGFYPAQRAAALDPIDALRFE
jgi:putative ABC transport system permease protein